MADSRINWYPGHMAKAKRMMQEQLRLIDIIIELVDARLPLASKNPDIDRLAGGKSRILLLNKADMADPQATAAWEDYFRAAGFYTLALDCRQKADVRRVSALTARACAAKIERDRKRGIKNRPLRAMIAGIPNVGKSTFINTFAGRASAKTGNKPGVTKGKQWVKLPGNIELLDTPGLLWPRLEDEAAAARLAAAGSINDDILHKADLAVELIDYLRSAYPALIPARYGIEPGAGRLEDLENIARARVCLMKGAEPDLDKAAALLIDDFRSGRLGRITLELPPQPADEEKV